MICLHLLEFPRLVQIQYTAVKLNEDFQKAIQSVFIGEKSTTMDTDEIKGMFSSHLPKQCIFTVLECCYIALTVDVDYTVGCHHSIRT